ncbi:MAG TPA: ATPase, T2SS/T4P/T4SS family [Kiritimatiellia bacterium]|nr:ATPase, T2SS/T4P/T4SS family [Kiritimatiellia bacterium]HRU70394.1 ATPase, T2SS/T4P/T4SS family [Kiritimatiellia bacterium]
MPHPVHYPSFQSALLQRGVLTEEQLQAVLDEAGKLPLERYLAQSRLVPPEALTLTVAAYFNLHPITLPATLVPPPELIDLIPTQIWARAKAIPLLKLGKRLTVVFGDPFDLMAQEEVARSTCLEIVPLVAAEREVLDALNRAKARADAANPKLAMENIMKGLDADIEFSSEPQTREESIDQTLETAEEAPVIRMVNMMLVEALRTGASDIHFEAMEKQSRLRYRIDGALIERPSPPRALHNAIVSRIKIMSDLDIAERRNPQDGRFKVKALKKEVDIRVSILPTIHGEKVVMRTLDKSNLAPSLASLGLDDFAYQAMKHAIEQPHGIILVTGPTGSGKTTTLYSCLQDLNTPDVNIVTAEDPVEYQIEGINQVHVNQQTGLTFASVLRSVLRQDPDIVLVGEIRDSETADIAVKAALTGHLVLSTLHTNDAAGVIPRLIDMGVPPFLIASSLILAQAQRLYRKLCTLCKKPAEIDPDVLTANQIDPAFFEGATIYEAGGCPKCNNIGFKGRGAFMEVLPVTDAIRAATVKGSPADVIRSIAIQEGMATLKNVGLMKVRDGVTSLRAALEVTGSE